MAACRLGSPSLSATTARLWEGLNVNSYGVATFYTTALPRGSDLVTAAYAGSVDYSSASAKVTQLVN